MSLKHSIVVILGATGVVGSGIAHAAVNEGAQIIAVGRDLRRLEAFKSSLALASNASYDAVALVVGDFHSEKEAKHTAEAVNATAIKLGGSINHVYSILGTANVGPASTETSLDDFKATLDSGLHNTFLAAKYFIPYLRSMTGASYTIASGGLAHFCPVPGFWQGTVKNAAVNALVLGLASETQQDAVRVNSACIHFGVAPEGADKNQFGMPGISTLRLGSVLIQFALKEGRKGELVCLDSIEAAEKLEF